jgi:hypothetical protein
MEAAKAWKKAWMKVMKVMENEPVLTTQEVLDIIKD